jgi:prolipoprotein diacylglyceryltransferase
MCVAFLIAAFSFFLGKQQHFPAAIRGSQILNVPMILILIVMIYWLIRVRVATAYNKAQGYAGPR